MTKRIAALSCCLSLVQGSVVSAQDIIEKRSAVVHAAPQDGPLRRASLSKDSYAMLRAAARPTVRPIQEGCRDSRSWMERHPVLTGALLGFGVGVLLTYAVSHDDDDELLTVISPGAAATFWGGVSAGVGALAGWGVGRNRDDGGACGGSDSTHSSSKSRR